LAQLCHHQQEEEENEDSNSWLKIDKSPRPFALDALCIILETRTIQNSLLKTL
jgi:hypothetical protein